MCGVIGVLAPLIEEEKRSASSQVYKGLLTLQHRGQDAAGILSFDKNAQRFFGHKDQGLVTEVFQKEHLDKLNGTMAIGHCRYATIATQDNQDLQPLLTSRPHGIAMVHNGNIVNYHALTRFLKDELKVQTLSANDLEVILNLWSYYISEYEKAADFSFEAACDATQKIMEVVEGGYCVVGMVADQGMIAFRDPDGIRPLVLGKKIENGKASYTIASETHPLNYLGYEYERDITPGELVFIDLDGNLQSKLIKQKKKTSACMFEWVYFASAESAIESRSVYRSRLRLGEALARRVSKMIEAKEISPEIVCPVPDTSRTAAISLAENIKLPYREGLIKNRYIQRSFILSDQEAREKAVELKLSPVISEVRGKNILLVDDSVVRGTTSKKIISLLKNYGAKEITLAITCPPISYGCYYGIDYPDEKDLVANNKTLDEIANWVGANKVIYLDEKDLMESIENENLCMACINKNYPTSINGAKEFKEKRNQK